LAHQPVALCAQLIDLGLHPGQQLFRGLCGDTRALKATDFAALLQDLAAPTFNFFPDVCDLHGPPPQPDREQKENILASRYK
jgi:hypothetical protein